MAKKTNEPLIPPKANEPLIPARSNEDGCLKTGITTLTLLVSIITAGVAVRGCQREETRANENARRLQEVEEQVKSLKTDLENKSGEVERQRRELQRSLDTYAIYYRDKVKNAQDAIDRYKSFDTEGNRKELGADFARRHRELFADAKIMLEALIDHVKSFRPVLAAFEKTLNGRVTALDEQIAQDNLEGILNRFGILRENVESDLDRLKQALDKATSNEPPNKALNPTGNKPAT
jgi:DNA repair exonuclease SbcCD ATPase subunit